VIVFLAVAIVLVRRSMKGAIVERLPLEDGEQVLLEEDGLKISSRGRKGAVAGGWTTTYKVRSVLTDRRIILATGGPEGKHKLVIKAIVDYTTPAPHVSESGYPAYLAKFKLSNGYPTYPVTADDVAVERNGSDAELRVVVPFPEGGSSFGPPPEVKITTSQAERYLEAVTAGR
jgi:hypothetical protein